MGLLYEEESYRVLGACFEVYKEKGPGFLEPVYQECLAIEFELSGISFRSRAELKLEYKGRSLKQTYQPDFIYLKATGLRLGLLVNYGVYPQLERRRIIR